MRLKVPSQTSLLKEVRVPGRFFPNGSSAVVNGDNVGGGFTVARDSQGLFTVTFDEEFKQYRLVSFVPHLRLSSAAARWAQAGDYSQSGPTAKVRVIDGSGNVQDIAANANNSVEFLAIFAKGSQDY